MPYCGRCLNVGKREAGSTTRIALSSILKADDALPIVKCRHLQ